MFVQEMYALENNLCKSVIEHNVQKQTFNFTNFYRNPTLDYLEKCNLNWNVMDSLLNTWYKLNFSCVKYLISHWNNGLYVWGTYFIDRHTHNRKMLIHFVCKYGCTQSVEYILNIYIEKKLDLGVETDNGWSLFSLLCCYCSFKTMNFVLDICIEKI